MIKPVTWLKKHTHTHTRTHAHLTGLYKYDTLQEPLHQTLERTTYRSYLRAVEMKYLQLFAIDTAP